MTKVQGCENMPLNYLTRVSLPWSSAQTKNQNYMKDICNKT